MDFDFEPECDCPMCFGPGVPLGTLGGFEWFRCRNCGAEFHPRVESDENETVAQT